MMDGGQNRTVPDPPKDYSDPDKPVNTLAELLEKFRKKDAPKKKQGE